MPRSAGTLSRWKRGREGERRKGGREGGREGGKEGGREGGERVTILSTVVRIHIY